MLQQTHFLFVKFHSIQIIFSLIPFIPTLYFPQSSLVHIVVNNPRVQTKVRFYLIIYNSNLQISSFQIMSLSVPSNYLNTCISTTPIFYSKISSIPTHIINLVVSIVNTATITYKIPQHPALSRQGLSGRIL